LFTAWQLLRDTGRPQQCQRHKLSTQLPLTRYALVKWLREQATQPQHGWVGLRPAVLLHVVSKPVAMAVRLSHLLCNDALKAQLLHCWVLALAACQKTHDRCC
jgi:hypothetical protein